ncbi:hypothetical protein N9937_01885 [bacterium]|nr:hypothetical protein [bacterium]
MKHDGINILSNNTIDLNVVHIVHVIILIIAVCFILKLAYNIITPACSELGRKLKEIITKENSI